MTFNKQIWEVITNGEAREVPDWICKTSFGEAHALVMNEALSCKTEVVDISYIRFLEEQIALGVRGAEWGKILEERLSTLRPLLGHAVTTVMIANGESTVTIRIDPESQKILHVEQV